MKNNELLAMILVDIISKIKSHARDIFGQVDPTYFYYNEICKTRRNVFLDEFFATYFLHFLQIR
jgi:hypothetical protein